MAKRVVISVIANVSNAVANFGKVDNALGKMGNRARAVGGAVTGAGQSMTALATVPIVGALGAALKVSGDFERGMNKVAAVSGATAEQLKLLRGQAKILGSTTKFSASQAAKAQGALAQAGFETTKILAAMPPVLSLAAAGELQLGSAASITANTLNGFGLAADQAGRVTDVLAKTAASADTNVQGLGFGFKYVAPIAKAAGYSVEQTAAAMGILSDAGIKGEQAGTSLRAILLKLVNPTAQAAKIMQQYGISATDSSGKLKSMTDIMGQFDKAGLSNAQVMQIFGDNAGTGFQALQTKGVPALTALEQKLNAAGGSAKQMADTMSKGFVGGMTSFTSALEGLAIAIGDTGLLGYAAELLGYTTNFVRWLGTLDPMVLKIGLGVAGVVAAIGPLLIAVGSVISAVGTISAGIGALMPIISAVGVAIGAVAGAVGAVPIAVTAAVAATAVGLYNLVKHWDTVSKYIVASAKGIADWFGSNWQQIGLFIASPVGYAISKFYESFSEARRAGQGLMQSFSQGIYDLAMQPVKLVQDIVGKIRSYLPGSDADTGALSDLTASGKALAITFAKGINSAIAPVVQAGSNVAASALPTSQAAPMLATAGGGSSTTTINFQPSINLSGSANEDDGRRLINALEPWATELNAILQRNLSRGNRR